MSMYQRYLSKSLILFFSLFFFLIFLLESNVGFKLFFNITNYFLWGAKTEEISGNWRDFKLKNITYNIFGISVKADSIRVLIDPISMFKSHKIFKKIDTSNLIVFLNKNNFFDLKKKYFKKNIFFNNAFFFKKIHADKILIKSNNINIILFNIYSGVKFINNNFTILRTYISSISLNIKKNNQEYFIKKTDINNVKNINNYLSIFLDHKKFSSPNNINLLSIQCKPIKYFHHKFNNVVFQGGINDKFKFQLQFNDVLKFNLYGKISLNHINHLLYVHLYMHRLLFPINQNLICTFTKFNMILKGTVDNYHVSLKNIINIPGMPSVMLHMLGNGNLTNISLNKINCIAFFNKVKHKKLINLKKIHYARYISQLAGKINISNNFNKGINNINIPYFNIKTNIIDKKLLILGALYYNPINSIKIPKISLFAGKNKAFIAGTISKRINVSSSINANNLDYFIPNLKGTVIATLNLYGLYLSPNISGVFFGENINYNDIIYLKSIKTYININTQKKFKKNIFLTITKSKFFKFYLDYLKIQINWNDTDQRLYLFLKNKNLTVDCIINGTFNHNNGLWKGMFKKINIFTFNKKWIINNNPMMFFYTHQNIQINKNHIKKHKSFIFNLILKVKKFLFSYIFNSSIHSKADLFFKTKFISETNKESSYVKMFVYSNNITLIKKIKNKVFTKKISSLKLFINFKKDNITTKWIIYPLQNKKNKLFGFLNIFDCFHKQNIRGKYFLFNFPCSIFNYVISNSTIVQGICNGNIKFFGTVYHPDVLADIHIKNFYIQSNKILKYIILFFYPSLDLVKYLNINQLIFIKQGDILFQLYSGLKKNIINSIEWNILFNSNQVVFFISPKIKLNLYCQLNLHYFLLKYDLVGYLKSCLFYFKINEKNFIF